MFAGCPVVATESRTCFDFVEGSEQSQFARERYRRTIDFALSRAGIILSINESQSSQHELLTEFHSFSWINTFCDSFLGGSLFRD